MQRSTRIRRAGFAEREPLGTQHLPAGAERQGECESAHRPRRGPADVKIVCGNPRERRTSWNSESFQTREVYLGALRCQRRSSGTCADKPPLQKKIGGTTERAAVRLHGNECIDAGVRRDAARACALAAVPAVSAGESSLCAAWTGVVGGPATAVPRPAERRKSDGNRQRSGASRRTGSAPPFSAAPLGSEQRGFPEAASARRSAAGRPSPAASFSRPARRCARR
jgi:hypothetical protein